MLINDTYKVVICSVFAATIQWHSEILCNNREHNRNQGGLFLPTSFINSNVIKKPTVVTEMTDGSDTLGFQISVCAMDKIRAGQLGNEKADSCCLYIEVRRSPLSNPSRKSYFSTTLSCFSSDKKITPRKWEWKKPVQWSMWRLYSEKTSCFNDQCLLL